MRLQPLPVPTRIYDGEDVTSYSYRHAARNHSQAGHIEIQPSSARRVWAPGSSSKPPMSRF